MSFFPRHKNKNIDIQDNDFFLFHKGFLFSVLS